MMILNCLFKQYGSRSGPKLNVGPDLRSIYFETRHQILLKSGYFTWDDLNSDDFQILLILQIVQELFEGTAYAIFYNVFIRIQITTSPSINFN